MIQGHGDDAFRFGRPILANFSSNVYAHVDLEPLKAHLRQRLDVIGRYPEPEPYSLERALAVRLGIDPDAVCVTNGATEAIYLTAHAFTGSRTTILQPTFNEYADACTLFAHSVSPVSSEQASAPGATRPSHGLLFGESSALRSLSASDRNCGWHLGREHFSASGTNARAMKGATVWICNPNNPTGSVVPKEQIVAAIEENPETVFVIDQSYGFFTKEPLLTAAEAVGYPNVVQLHSMTKRYAIPGLRLGYVTANPTLLERIRAVRMPWSVNALAIEAGLYLCEHLDTGLINLDALLAETRRLREALNALPGLSAEPTQTHFFLCHLAEGSAADLKQWLAERHGILIRDASNFEGLDAGHFRIATQTAEENDALVAAVKQYLEERL